jgi:outer membrane receptor for ferrienterochelin and colicins
MTRLTLAAAGAAAILLAAPLQAQVQPARITVRAASAADSTPLAGVSARADTASARTDAEGRATLAVRPGLVVLTLSRLGYAPDTLRFRVAAGDDTTVSVLLQRRDQLEEVRIGATRTARRLEDQPTRVEVIGAEEIAEKLLMTPGDIAMLLNETSGLRVQTTSPALGAASVRVQGLRGRYTSLLSDGLPLHGGSAGGLGLLQVPPMDLGRVEVIKGAASSLYGPSALGGVINLVSRRPAFEPESELLLNVTSREGADAVAWHSRSFDERWGMTLLGGAHRQAQHDVDGDGWTDLASYRRGVLRPRLFHTAASGRATLLTVGTTVETRQGGTMPGRLSPAGTPYTEGLETRRLDGGMTMFIPLPDRMSMDIRASASTQGHEHTFGSRVEDDRHTTLFGEFAVRFPTPRATWVLGMAAQTDRYQATQLPAFDYDHGLLSLFLAGDFDPVRWASLSTSARVDAHNEYGTHISPRISALLRLPDGAMGLEGWTLRPALATGWFAPTPFTEEVEAVGLGVVEPLRGVRAEGATTWSLDLGGPVGAMELNGTVFGSEVRRPVATLPVNQGTQLRVINAAQPTRVRGAELLARLEREPFVATATYTFLSATELDVETGARRDVPLLPRHAIGSVVAWEDHDRGRIGLELYYTGQQSLADDPYRTISKPYLVVGALVERRVGPVRAFVNLENMADARQTRTNPLVRPVPGPGGRWTTDAWSELAGRTINGGVRIEFH